MSPSFIRSYSHPLSLIVAAVLTIYSGTTAAADFADDAQAQARELLAGKVVTHSAAAFAPRETRGAELTADAQESARRLLLGAADSRVQATATPARPEKQPARVQFIHPRGLLVHDDAQATAQRLLLGQHKAAAGS